MVRSPLILAALAKAAAPSLNFIDVKTLSSGTNGAFDTALLTSTTGEHYTVKIANSQTAVAEQEVELRALKALSKAGRMHLPFKVTNMVGEVKDEKGSRALVFEFVYGNQSDITKVGPDTPLANNIARAIAAIHNLDVELIENEHLPSFEPAEILRNLVAELDRVAATGKVPPSLLSRWELMLEDSNLFRFKPTVIHGGLNDETLLTLDDDVSGILNWSTLRIADPAEDFAWVFGGGAPELAESMLDIYRQYHFNVDESLSARARLYSEFEFARWLMFGISKKDPEIIDEAILMIQSLAHDIATAAAEEPKIEKTYPVTAPIQVIDSDDLPTKIANKLF